MASSVKIYPRRTASGQPVDDPLPQLIQTPSGLALLELQGTINLPEVNPAADGRSPAIPIGKILFPDYNPNALDPTNTAWMQRVHFYVGQHQRLTGEVKKLPRAIAVIRRQSTAGEDTPMKNGSDEEKSEDLEVVEIVKYKLVFSQRPEPVTSTI